MSDSGRTMSRPEDGGGDLLREVNRRVGVLEEGIAKLTLDVARQRVVLNRVYCVFKEGYYRHECGGVFKTPEEAVAAADRLACSDRDDHHRYTVVPFLLGDVARPNSIGGIEQYRLYEPESLYSVTKSEAHRKAEGV